jgi:anaerobic magnesium-protoporphyrin IX monomethyl ester cyclase
LKELQPFVKKEAQSPRPMEPDADTKHLAMLKAIAPYAKGIVQKNVTTIDLTPATRKTKIMLILMPEWATMFPPFNLARLSAVAKGAGYDSKCLDLNIKAFNYLRPYIKDRTLDFDPWDGTREWKWLGDNYHRDIHPILEPLWREWIEKIKEFNPTVVALTQYYCNEQPVLWMARELKKAIPGIKIATGGPNMQVRYNHIDPVFDYAVTGEGEQILLEILEELENGIVHEKVVNRKQPEEQRLNLNGLPMPDYTDFDFSEYQIPNGVNSELSRGCTAKCTFCEETHFWKYRQRQATDVLSEIEWLYYNKGTDVIWFIDSLINGNLKELRAFCKGIIAKEMKVHWTGYGRCDGRMDLEYYQDLADAGCFMINYGIESGSQKVLDDMDKGVTIAEMEQNFKDGKKTGVQAFTNWIVGFPTEEHQDFADTMTFLWRNRNQNIVNIAAGFGFGLGMATVAGQNPEKFGLSHHKYCDGWIRKDFTLSKFHVLYRIKGFAVFLQHLLTENDVTVPNRPNLPKDHYRIVFDDPTLQKEIEYEKFDYNIIETGISAFADTLVNEVFVMFRMLWRTRGGFTAKIIYDQDLDTREFGERNVGPYWASHRFKIDHDGNWQADFAYEFKQPPANIKPADPLEPRAPFFAQDYSRETSNAAQRARKIAKPEWKGGDSGRDHEEFMALIEEERILNETVDLSFKYKWKGTGYWGDEDQHVIDVPSEHVRESFGEVIEAKKEKTEKLISPIITKKSDMLKNFKSNIPGM